MSEDYKAVFSRFSNERNRVGLSQKEISYHMKMSQSQFSKEENGNGRFSYYGMQGLADTQMDIFYIYTGKRYSGRYYEWFANLDFARCLSILGILAEMLSGMARTHQISGGRNFAEKMERLAHVALFKQGKENIYYELRKKYSYSQSKMADMLGTDRKKLISLEKERILPDSEDLYVLQERFGVYPSIMLEDARGVASAICHLLEMVDVKLREKIFEVLREYVQVMNSTQ